MSWVISKNTFSWLQMKMFPESSIKYWQNIQTKFSFFIPHYDANKSKTKTYFKMLVNKPKLISRLRNIHKLQKCISGSEFHFFVTAATVYILLIKLTFNYKQLHAVLLISQQTTQQLSRRCTFFVRQAFTFFKVKLSQ